MSLRDEMQVIGSIFHHPPLLLEIDLAPDEFETYTLRRIYDVAREVDAAGDPVDIITVSDRLERDEGDSEQWVVIIARAQQEAISTATAKHYAERVRRDYKARQARRIAETLARDSQEDGAADEAIKALMELNITQRRYECGLTEACAEMLDHLDEMVNGDGALRGVRTGLADIDHKLGGLHNSDLIVLGARPAMGKTAILLNMALAADATVGIISAEQPRIQMGGRLMAIDGRVPAKKMRTGDFQDEEWKRLVASVARLNERRMRFYDKPAPSIAEVCRQARAWKHSYDIRALYVDYIQRLKVADPSRARHEQVGEIVMTLKELARDLDIPVLALAQVNRNVENRADRRPGMADLKDSGVIEQEADVVMFLYRDEVYDPDTRDVGLAEVDVSKNRHGPIGTTKVVWMEEYMRFENLASG